MEPNERLRKFIKTNNMTLNKISKQIKMSPSALSKILTGNARLVERTISILKYEYNLNPQWLLHGEEPMHLDPPKPSFQDNQQQELNDIYEKIPEDSRDRIITIAREEKLRDQERKRRREEENENRLRWNSRLLVEKSISVPILGSVQAGTPTIDYNHIKGYMEFDVNAIHNPNRTFWLKVLDDSMIDCNIQKGDMLLIEQDVENRNGDIVVAKIDQTNTIKKIRIMEEIETVELIPCNPRCETIKAKSNEVEIIGVVTATSWKRKR